MSGAQYAPIQLHFSVVWQLCCHPNCSTQTLTDTYWSPFMLRSRLVHTILYWTLAIHSASTVYSENSTIDTINMMSEEGWGNTTLYSSKCKTEDVIVAGCYHILRHVFTTMWCCCVSYACPKYCVYCASVLFFEQTKHAPWHARIKQRIVQTHLPLNVRGSW